MKNNKPQKEILMDVEGYNQYLAKIQSLTDKLKKMGKETIDERSFGGTDSEVGEGYLIKDQEIKQVQSQISLLVSDLPYITIIQKHNKDNLIDVGDTLLIRLINENNVDEFIIRLVGGTPDHSAEINQVSLNSPIGKAIYEKEVGTTCDYLVGNNKFTVTVLEKLNKKLSK